MVTGISQVQPYGTSRITAHMGAPVRIGDVLAKKYKITKILGMGGMGVVVAARHCELNKLVALKFMHEEVSSNKQITERFLREARAAARLQNEHVVHVLDVDRLPNGVPYIVLEYLEGQDLGQLIECHGSLEVADAVEYVLQACEAMAEAHAQGIIHRDLKPQNLFLTTRQDGRRLVKVLDFGISKLQFSQNPTFTSQILGSPSYMAPEQIRSSRSVDARADVWSLGVILYQLLTNTLPFVGDTVPEVIFKILTQPPAPLIRRGIPASLLNAIDRCLEKEPGRRFANVAEFAHELVPFTPERARAAMSLIERVMTSSMQQPRSSMPDEELAAMLSNENAAIDPLPGLPSQSLTQTTLGTAASGIPAGRLRFSRLQQLIIAFCGIAAVATIVIVAMYHSAPPPLDVVPLRRAIVSNDAGPVVDAAVIDVSPDTTLDTSRDTLVDAALDTVLDASVQNHAKAVPVSHVTPRGKPRATSRQIVIDAGAGRIPVDAPFLEPALTDDVPVLPRR